MNIFQQLAHDTAQMNSRRQFLKTCAAGLGTSVLASLGNKAFAGATAKDGSLGHVSHFAPKAKRVIFLHMAGAPSQLEMFDYKPFLAKKDGLDCPQKYIEGKRFAFIQGVPKLLGPQYQFKQAGQTGQWISDRLPHHEKIIDDLCIIKSMHTDQFNHAPAQLLMHTGNALLGNPSIGSWVTYGLGSDTENIPGYIVLASGGKAPSAGKSIWGSGFLPSVYQGVQCRSKGDPVLYLNNPQGISQDVRRQTMSAINQINKAEFEQAHDPEILTRIAQYEMSFRMQIHANEAFDIKSEPQYIQDLYGAEPGKESFANNCLLARRLAERGTRYIQLFDWGWDSHGASDSEAINVGFKRKCHSIDKAIYGLITDLKQRGLLEDTLIVWGGEFGRTPMRENRGGQEMQFIGRDHNPGAFTMWMAGAGAKPGSFGETDDIGYQAVSDRVSVQDLQATILSRLGMDHHKLNYPFQGLDQTLPGVTKPAKVQSQLFST